MTGREANPRCVWNGDRLGNTVIPCRQPAKWVMRDDSSMHGSQLRMPVCDDHRVEAESLEVQERGRRWTCVGSVPA